MQLIICIAVVWSSCKECRYHASKDKVSQIRKSLENDEDVSCTLVNYRSDGTPFWNKLFIAALRDDQNQVVTYMGVSVEVAGPEPSDPEHGKELPKVTPAVVSDDNTGNSSASASSSADAGAVATN